VQKCQQLGFHISDERDIVTTSWVAAQYLQTHGVNGKVYLIGSPGMGDELQLAGLKYVGIGPDHVEKYTNDVVLRETPLDEDIGAVLVGYDVHFSMAKLFKAASYLKNPRCVFVATNTDRYFPLFNNPLAVVPGTGTIVDAVISASDRQPIILGKPEQPMFDFLCQIHHIVPDKTLMVGDRIASDINFGRKFGMKTLLVETGSNKEIDAIRNFQQGLHDLVPNFVTESLSNFLQFLQF